VSKVDDIDWSAHDEFSENTCYCRCGAVFRSHVKLIELEQRWVSATRKPCSGCGSRVNCKGIESDPETFTIKGKKDAL